MREEIIRWATFNELDKDNQAKAIEDTRCSDSYLDYEWYDGVDEDFLAVLKILGYYEIETYFSGFHSQGDGASFKAMYLYEKGSLKAIRAYAPQDIELYRIAQELQTLQKRGKYDIGSSITTTGRYSHEMTMSCLNWSNNDLISEDISDRDTEEFLELHRDLARWYYKSLNSNYEYLMSDEAIKEQLITNEMEWQIDSEGDIV